MKDPDGLTLAKAVFDGLGHALLVIDRDLNLCLKNPRAQRLLDEGTFLTEHGGRLAGATDLLECALRDAAGGLAIGRCEKCTIRAADGVAAFMKRLPAGLEPAILLAILDPRDRDTSGFAEAFGLTPAEARVAARLASGCTPKQIAADCRVSTSTVRSQVQSVFGKVGVHRQADLVRMLLLASA